MECINETCSNDLTGKQIRYCSDKCRKQATRTTRTEQVGQMQVGQPNPDKVGQVISPVDNTLTITEAQIDTLPVGVVRPGRSDAPYFNTPSYRETVAKLVNWTATKLKVNNVFTPNWKQS